MRREHDIMIETPVLPSGYSRLNYIECSGTQYIDTGVKPNPNFKWHFVNQWLELNTGDNNMNGCENWGSDRDNDVIVRISNRPEGNRGISIVFGDIVNYKHYVSYDYFNTNKTTFYLENGHQYINGVEVSQGIITKSSRLNIYFFATNDGVPNHFCKKSRVYYSWMKSDDTFIRNFIPAIKLSNSKPGLYDTINNVFYTNRGTGEFLYA